MKRILALLLTVLLLTACASEPTATVEHNGMTFTLDTENQTITEGSNVYDYEISTNAAGRTYTITYPDGAVYSMTNTGNISSGGGNQAYYDTDRLDGGILIDILEDQMPREKKSSGFVIGIICIALGAFDAALPHAAWYLSRGWHYKNAEPSDLAITMTRAGGIVVIIAGIILLFI